MEAKPNFILPLSDATAGLSQVGGKGASLAKMIQAGFPVPDGFHVTTETYRAFIAANGLQPKILSALEDVDASLPATLEAASATISRFFAESKIPTDLANVISEAYAALSHPNPSPSGRGARGEGVPVAVRSSATAEDLPEVSFAGQQETFLNIRGAEALLEAVKKCWASLWTAHAIAYRINNNIDQNTVMLAVVVQEMVNAEAAGILFTANPINGRRDEMLINAAWGLGDAIVGGLVSPDTIVADKTTGKVKTMEVAEKTVITVLTESGTREEPLDDARRSSKVMNEADVAALVEIARRIESFYGSPQDIEWCRVTSPSPSGRGARGEGKFFIVQSRPITALPACPAEGGEPPMEWLPSQPHTIAARMSFVEFVPDAVPPLFATLAVPLVTQATTKMMVDVLGFRGEAGYYFEVVNGYVYGCLDTRTTLQYGLRGTLGMSKILRYGKARREEVQANSRAAADKWRQANLAALPAIELLAGVRELFGAAADYFTVAQSAPIPLSTMSEMLFRNFYNALVKRKSDPAAATFLLGLDNIPLQAEKSIFDLAQWAAQRGQADLADYLRQTPAQVIGEALQADPIPAPLSGEFADRFAAYLAAFGHVVYDLDFSKSVPADDPLPLLNALQVYLTGRGHNPHTRLQMQAEQRRQAEQAITRRLGPLRRKWFQKLLKSAQACAPERENAIADLGLTYPQIRRLLREVGRRLVAGGALGQSEDVYWLEAQEVDTSAASLDKHEPLTSYSANVEIRKADWQQVRKITPPTALPEKSWLSRFMTPKKSDGNTLKGHGASAGQITAPACVLRGPEDFGQMHPGDVIVAVTTTPAWTPLFAIASAVVTDIGGPLSHSSIVAREYGIPAVMATGVATRRIHTGQMITVDGTTGTVALA